MKLSTASLKQFIFNHKVAVIGTVVVLGLIYGGYSYFKPAAAATTQASAEAKVTRGDLEVTVTGTGTVVPYSTQAIVAKTDGTVKAIHVKNGDRVQKGDLLYELESNTLALQLEKARLDVEKAQINIGDTAEELAADTIIAPFSGRIIGSEAKTGSDTSKNSVLATLQDDSHLVFDMPVTSEVAAKATLNQKIEVFLPDQGSTLAGTVISKAGQGAAGRAYLKVAVAASGDLTAGQKAFGTLSIDGKQVDALAVSTLAWRNEVQLKATLSGTVKQAYVEEGQAVNKGQKLFYLTSSTNLSQQRLQAMNQQQAELSLDDLQNQLADLQITAPTDGVISGMDVEVGDEVTSQSSKTSLTSTSATTETTVALGKILKNEQMKIAFSVDEVDIAKVKLGMEALVTVDALPDQEFKGKVTEIAEEGTVTNNVSSFEVTIVVANPDKMLKSGMTANLSVMVAQKKQVLLIPIEALQERGDSKLVMLPGQEGSEQRRNFQPIKVGLTNETYAEVTQGLKEGATILLPGVQQSNVQRQGGGMPGLGGAMGGGRPPGSGSRGGN